MTRDTTDDRRTGIRAFGRGFKSLRPHSTYNHCGAFCRFTGLPLTRGKLLTDGGLLEAPELAEHFEGGELRLEEDTDGWEGYVREDGVFYHVDTRLPIGDWCRKVRVGPRAVRLALEERGQA